MRGGAYASIFKKNIFATLISESLNLSILRLDASRRHYNLHIFLIHPMSISNIRLSPNRYLSPFIRYGFFSLFGLAIFFRFFRLGEGVTSSYIPILLFHVLSHKILAWPKRWLYKKFSKNLKISLNNFFTPLSIEIEGHFMRHFYSTILWAIRIYNFYGPAAILKNRKNFRPVDKYL